MLTRRYVEQKRRYHGDPSGTVVNYSVSLLPVVFLSCILQMEISPGIREIWERDKGHMEWEKQDFSPYPTERPVFSKEANVAFMSEFIRVRTISQITGNHTDRSEVRIDKNSELKMGEKKNPKQKPIGLWKSWSASNFRESPANVAGH